MKPCKACKHSYMEPDGEPVLVCGHPLSGDFGLYLRSGRVEHCDKVDKFEQRPLRTEEGGLKLEC